MTITPKEKADELVKGFAQYSAVRLTDLTEYDIQRRANAVQCALLCVEHIMETPIAIKIYAIHDKIYGGVEYWQEVKKELMEPVCEGCNGKGWIYRDAITDVKINCKCKNKTT